MNPRYLLAPLAALLLALLLPRAGRAQPAFATLSGGSTHSLLLLPDGSLRAWGDNTYGQLGDGSNTNRPSPVAVGSAATYAQVAGGYAHSLGLRADGTLWAWGYNSAGQLGDGSTTNRPSPVQVGTARAWRQVAAGSSHSLALAADGTLWGWGANAIGQLGDGTTTNRPSPVQVGTGSTWLSVAAGYDHSLAVRADGTLWAWGYNFNGQLGDGSSTIQRTSPVQVGTATTWLAVEGGDSHSLALRADGTLWAWGANYSGQVGDGSTTQRPSPTQVGTGRLWRSVWAGNQYSAAIAADGTLWAWGYNGYGQLGNGTAVSRTSPIQVGTASTWVSVSLGDTHALALRADGSVWAWGDNSTSQLGDGTTTQRSSPQRVAGVAGLPTRSLSAGLRHSAGVDVRGRLENWGSGGNGRLGTGGTAASTTPVAAGSATGWVQAMTGSGSFSLGVQADGTLWGWGYDANSQLGDGGSGNVTTPKQLGTGQLWRQAWGGENHGLALRADGTLWAWGNNDYGQVGDGTTTLRATPVQVGSGTVWRSVGGGNSHSLAIAANGTLWAWGLNTSGQLGLGSTTNGPSPALVGGGGLWLAVEGGFAFSIGLQATGTVYAWGDNGQGQLGDDSLTPRSTPGALSSAVPYTQVGAGDSHSLGRRADGTLWAWGLNGNGQLGDNTTTTRRVPTREATNGTNWLAVAGGGTHSLARTANGPNFFSTGDNTYGQLGDGTTTQSLLYTRTGDPDGQPLPVQLVSFTATAAGPAAVRLAWTTASEAQSAYFAVERSPDGRAWVELGRVAAAGTSASARQYAYLAGATPAGVLYYRLRQVDVDGSRAYSPVRAVTLGAAGLALFPNPTHGAATLTGAPPGAAVTVLDALGRVAATAPADATGTAVLALPAGLAPGVYVVRAGPQALRLTVQ